MRCSAASGCRKFRRKTSDRRIPKPIPRQHPLVHRVLIVDSIAPAGEERLAKAVQIIRAPDSDPDTIRRLARDADGVITRSKLPDDLFLIAPRVRAVAIHGTGTDLVPLADATARGVMVSNIPGGNAQSVAEYCAMAMLVLARNVLAITNALRSETWDGARALGVGGVGAEAYADIDAGVLKVEGVGVALRAVTNDGHFLCLDKREVCVCVVVGLCHFCVLSFAGDVLPCF